MFDLGNNNLKSTRSHTLKKAILHQHLQFWDLLWSNTVVFSLLSVDRFRLGGFVFFFFRKQIINLGGV